jgi:outer membrane autotransporter protein
VTPQLGHYSAGTVYQILTTTNALGGAFAGLTVNGDFTGALALDYATNSPDDVDLDVTTAGFSLLVAPPGLNQNQQNVLNGINNAILQGDSIPTGFLNLGNLSGAALSNALTQLEGQPATGAETSTFQLMTDFLNLLSDPSSGGGGSPTGGGAPGFAPEQEASLPPDIAQAYAAIMTKAPPAQQNFDQRWSAWGSAYGGAAKLDGNPVAGSGDVTASDYGFAAGMDYRATPGSVYGFALAGGGTNWSVAQNLGTGRSDSFQIGVHDTTHWGPLYLSGALAFANHWFTTNRIALGDQLTAKFDGQSYAARGEAGYRYAVPITGAIIGVTPYAALQVQDFHTPSFSETDLTGGGLGLSFAAQNATDTRSELGARFDNVQIVDAMPLVLRARLAWAHDWVSNPSLGAVFQALPGSNFTVNGAAPPTNSALTTASTELHITANWSMIAKFDGEFASTAQTYAGTGTLRYSW